MQYVDILTLTSEATEAIPAYRFVTHLGALAGEDENALGVARAEADAAGELVPVGVLGTAIVEAGDAVLLGAALGVDAQGRAVPIDGDTYTVVVARALQAAAGAGDLFEALLIPN